MNAYAKRILFISLGLIVGIVLVGARILLSKYDEVEYQNSRATEIVQATISFLDTQSAPTWTPTITSSPTAVFTPTSTLTPTITPTAEPCGIEFVSSKPTVYQFPALVEFDGNVFYPRGSAIVAYYKLLGEPWWKVANGWVYVKDVNTSACTTLPEVGLNYLSEEDNLTSVFGDTFNSQGTDWTYSDILARPEWKPSPHGTDYYELVVGKEEQAIRYNQAIPFSHLVASMSFDAVQVSNGYVGFRIQSAEDENTYVDLKFDLGITACKYEAVLYIDNSPGIPKKGEFSSEVCGKGISGENGRRANFLQVFFDYDKDQSVIQLSGVYNGKQMNVLKFKEEKGYFSQSYFNWISSNYRTYIDYVVVKGR
jgi:hypothetical protein